MAYRRARPVSRSMRWEGCIPKQVSTRSAPAARHASVVTTEKAAVATHMTIRGSLEQSIAQSRRDQRDNPPPKARQATKKPPSIVDTEGI